MGSALYFGGLYLFLLCLLISAAGLYELYKIYKIEKTPLGIVGFLTACGYYIAMYTGADWAVMLVLTLGLMLAMAVYVACFPKYVANQVMCSIFGVFYVAVMMSYIFKTRTLNDGVYVVWLIFVSSWVSDTFAYLTGVTLGKHKMTPKLSPKKSVEGAVGGVASSVLVGALYGYIVSPHMTQMVLSPVFVFAVAGGIGALLSIVGDLAASAIKRNFEVKDYGNIIPGHGGILDRFDSVIFTAPVVYWAVYIVNAFL
jgi:phosphatidate cytidylyltransferase